MLVPLSWLKEYVDIDVTPQELEKKLFDGGFEVEELYQVGHDIDKIVVGLVETVSRFRRHIFMCVRLMQVSMALCRFAAALTMYRQAASIR